MIVALGALLLNITLKWQVGRLRPDLFPGRGLYAWSSYPSGHAAYAMLYVWIALTVTLRTRPGRVWGSALIVAAIVLAAAIGVSRVYLRAHFLSDVGGGWALGASAFALCAVIGLVVTHLRGGEGDERGALAPE